MLAWILALSAVFADEGMWLPDQVGPLGPSLAQAGMTVPVRDLMDLSSHPLGAIVSLGHCSGALVSDDGLVVTNHHCVLRALQVNSDAAHDRAREGYLALTRAQELPTGPNFRIAIIERMEDVTERVTAGIRTGRRATPDDQRRAVIERASKTLVAECERAQSRRCRVVEQDGGMRYLLEVKREIQDVRLVYAPPTSVGSYGGEIDNWMWPRHAGDFAFLRAYVGPDGTTAPPSPDNVTLETPNHLMVDSAGVQPGDVVWMAGFPGHTRRNALALELEHTLTRRLPAEITLSRSLLEILRTSISAHPDTAPILAAPIAGLENGIKYKEGLLARLGDGRALAAKKSEEAALLAWIAEEEDRTVAWGGVLEQTHVLIAEGQAHPERDALVSRLVRDPDLLATAHTGLRMARESQRPLLDQDPGYQARDRARHQGRFQRLDHTLELTSDRAVTRTLLLAHQALPPAEQVPEVSAWLTAQGGVSPALERLYSAMELARLENRMALLDASVASLEASTDPWLELACALETHLVREREAHKQRTGAFLRLRPQVQEAMNAFREGPVYPDADGTLRLTFGSVEGAVPRDGLMYLPQTTVGGMVAKAGPPPFDVPDWLLAAAREAPASRFVDPVLLDVPVAFLSNLEATGGNSGSATLNADGELVGLVHDVTWESIASDWVFEASVARSVHVDVRYLLWVLSVTPGAENLLAELLGKGAEF